MSAVEEIRIKLEHRLHQVEAEIDSLREALRAMATAAGAHGDGAPGNGAGGDASGDGAGAGDPGNGALAAAELTPAAPPHDTPTQDRTARRAGTRRSAAAGRRGASGQPSRTTASRDRAREIELERRLAETGGMTAVELARETGTDYAEVLERIRELERAGRGREPRA